MQGITQSVNETGHAGDGRPAGGAEDPVQRYQALRRALKHAADIAMLEDDAAEAANKAMALLRAEFLWRFELLRSRQRQPVLIVPEPLTPTATVSQSNA
jgi:hypothetical protein